MGDYNEALVYQQRAVLMSERVLGIDHPNTITEYVSARVQLILMSSHSNKNWYFDAQIWNAFVCGILAASHKDKGGIWKPPVERQGLHNEHLLVFKNAV
jgi:hypothetical protein